MGDEPHLSEMTKYYDTNSEVVETNKALPHLITFKDQVYKYTYTKLKKVLDTRLSTKRENLKLLTCMK